MSSNITFWMETGSAANTWLAFWHQKWVNCIDRAWHLPTQFSWYALRVRLRVVENNGKTSNKGNTGEGRCSCPSNGAEKNELYELNLMLFNRMLNTWQLELRSRKNMPNWIGGRRSTVTWAHEVFARNHIYTTIFGRRANNYLDSYWSGTECGISLTMTNRKWISFWI